MVFSRSSATISALRNHCNALACAVELAHRIQGLRTRLQIGQIRSARERVIHALKLKCNEKVGWTLDITFKHFAEEIGLTHESKTGCRHSVQH